MGQTFTGLNIVWATELVKQVEGGQNNKTEFDIEQQWRSEYFINKNFEIL